MFLMPDRRRARQIANRVADFLADALQALQKFGCELLVQLLHPALITPLSCTAYHSHRVVD